MKKSFKIITLVLGLIVFLSACKSTHRADFNPIKRKSVRACPSF